MATVKSRIKTSGKKEASLSAHFEYLSHCQGGLYHKGMLYIRMEWMWRREYPLCLIYNTQDSGRLDWETPLIFLHGGPCTWASQHRISCLTVASGRLELTLKWAPGMKRRFAKFCTLYGQTYQRNVNYFELFVFPVECHKSTKVEGDDLSLIYSVRTILYDWRIHLICY